MSVIIEKFITSVTFLIDEIEGGYSNRKNDLGTETKYGICKRSYPHLDIKNLTKEQAIDIYFKDFWEPNNCTVLPFRVSFLVFDGAVNSGAKNSNRWLQQSCNLLGCTLKIDSDIGPKTIEAVNSCSRTDLITKMIAQRISFYTALVRKKPAQIENLAGWNNRIVKVMNFISEPPK